MDRKYDPGSLLMQFALHYEVQGKMVFSVDVADLKNTKIQIFKKDSEASPFHILKDPKRPDAAVLLLSGTRIMSHDALEKEKDNLGKVVAYHEGRPPVEFDTYQEFLNWLQIE
jgi:hypothetical protein